MSYREVKLMIQSFEDGTYPKEAWTHRAHFIMALWYTYHEPIHKAKKLIKEGIKNYNVRVGGKNTDDAGYHETITELYIQIIVQYQLSFTTDYNFEILLEGLDNQVFLDKEFPFNYYQKHRLMSKEARKRWVVPDLKPILGLEIVQPAMPSPRPKYIVKSKA
ncbi:hypothetical protein QQ008_27230 [Fulvivirgaceae bacterium BMA10]|uniref:Uncharacterized protein n=1 Tax=Splendidivirga corallicola TaxID=3051826 RepID=A0ABT8L0E5_9BACT|nr:hypothetical protein [Fulvivirgaceae bacterium BMA10]